MVWFVAFQGTCFIQSPLLIQVHHPTPPKWFWIFGSWNLTFEIIGDVGWWTWIKSGLWIKCVPWSITPFNFLYYIYNMFSSVFRNVHPINIEFLLRTYKVYKIIYIQFLQLSSARFLNSCNMLSSNIFQFDNVLTYFNRSYKSGDIKTGLVGHYSLW